MNRNNQRGVVGTFVVVGAVLAVAALAVLYGARHSLSDQQNPPIQANWSRQIINLIVKTIRVIKILKIAKTLKRKINQAAIRSKRLKPAKINIPTPNLAVTILL